MEFGSTETAWPNLLQSLFVEQGGKKDLTVPLGLNSHHVLMQSDISKELKEALVACLRPHAEMWLVPSDISRGGPRIDWR